MEPTLGKITFVQFKKQKEYRPGDIVCFKGHNNKFYVHRIIAYTGVYFWAKGDNAPQREYEKDVPVKNIKGKLVWQFPNHFKK